MKNNMKKIITAVLLLFIIIVLPVTIQAEEQKPAAPEQNPVEQKQEEDKVTGQVDLSVLSAYIWRGQEMTRYSVVTQPSATIAYKGFSLNGWGNLDTRPYSAGNDKYSSNFTETDVTLSYTHKFGIVSVGAGYIYYGLAAAAPGGPDLMDSQEIFATVSVDTILTPTLTIFKEIDHYHQWYALLAASHMFTLHKRVGLKLAGSISYLKSEDETTYPKYDSSSLAIADKFNNFHDATLAISLPVSVTKNITITPLVTYVFPLSDDAKYEMRARGLQGAANPSDRDSAFLYGGVTLSFAF